MPQLQSQSQSQSLTPAAWIRVLSYSIHKPLNNQMNNSSTEINGQTNKPTNQPTKCPVIQICTCTCTCICICLCPYSYSYPYPYPYPICNTSRRRKNQKNICRYQNSYTLLSSYLSGECFFLSSVGDLFEPPEFLRLNMCSTIARGFTNSMSILRGWRGTMI